MRRIVLWAALVMAAVGGVVLWMGAAEGASTARRAFSAGDVTSVAACSLSINGAEAEWVSLPHQLRLAQGDAARMTIRLPDGMEAGDVLAFEADEADVRAWVDGRRLPLLDEPGAPRHIVVAPVPEGSAGRTAVIEIEKRTGWVPYMRDRLDRIQVGRPIDMLLKAYGPIYGPAWLAAMVSLMLSLALMAVALWMWRLRAMGSRLFLFLSVFVILSVWALADNPLTAMALGRALVWRRLSLMLEATFLVPVMLYFGECYRGKYRAPLRRMAVCALALACALAVMEAAGCRTMLENLLWIHAAIVLESLVIVGIIVRELAGGNRRDRLTGIGALILAMFGMLDMGIMVLTGRSPAVGSLYLAAPVAQLLGAAQIAVAQWKEARAAESLRHQHQQVVKLLDMEREHYLRLSDQLQDARKVRHDFNHYVALLQGAVKTGDMSNIKRLLGRAESVQQSMRLRQFADSPELNAILSQAADRCDLAGIPFEAKAKWPGDDGPGVYDVCIVLGNLLSNAIDAAEKCPGERHVLVDIAAHNRALVLRVENTCAEGLGQPWTRSSKKDAEAHGLGLKIVREILQEYGGELIIGNGKGGSVRVDAVFGS